MHKAARQRPGRFILAAAMLIVLGGFIAWQRGRDAVGDVAPDGTAQAAAVAPSAAAPGTAERPVAAPVGATTVTRTTNAADWPASLRDSEPDGAVTLDAAGRVRASQELRRLFDYFLSAIGEIDVAAIRVLLLDHVRALHGEAVAAEVGALFDRYVDYQQALAAMNAPIGESLRARLERVRDLRRRLLEPGMVEAFFGDEERYTEYTLDRRDVMSDRALDEHARDERLREIEARLSPEQRASQREANVAVLVEEQNRQFDALRLDPAQRQAEREALFGAEAAARLAAADAEVAAWDARVQAYVLARDAIRNDARLDAAARDRAIEALLRQSFDAAEQRRVGSLEAINRLQGLTLQR